MDAPADRLRRCARDMAHGVGVGFYVLDGRIL